MANKILAIGPSESIPYSNYYLEKWRDIDKDATNNLNHINMAPIYLSDYIAYLATEIYTDASTCELSNILAETNIQLDPNGEPPIDSISAIALTVKCGYDQAIDTYDKFMQPYRWRIAKLVNVKAVMNSIHNIFTWTPGERILDPEFGSRLRKYLYEGITDYNVETIMSEIKGTVSRYEPRANIVEVVNASTIEETEDNTVHLKIVFTIPSLDDQQYEYSYYYNKGDDYMIS